MAKDDFSDADATIPNPREKLDDTPEYVVIVAGKDKESEVPMDDFLINGAELLEKSNQVGKDLSEVEEAVKSISKQGKGRRQLNEDFSDHVENVTVKLTLPPETVERLHQEANKLLDAGLVDSVDAYVDEILKQNLPAPKEP